MKVRKMENEQKIAPWMLLKDDGHILDVNSFSVVKLLLEFTGVPLAEND